MKTMKRKWFLLLLALLTVTTVSANYEEINKTLNIGEEYSCDISSYMDYSKWNGPRNWRVSSYLTVVAEYSTSCRIRADQYVSGTLMVVCDWQEINASNNYEITRRVTWNFTINKVDVQSVRIEDCSVTADQSTDIYMTVSPSNATVLSGPVWTIEDPSIASISGTTVRGLQPGTTTVYCTVNGSVRSNTAKVSVHEPSFLFHSFSISDGATDVETKPTITATYSHTLSRSTAFNDIALTDDKGKKVAGSTTLSNATIQFTPSQHLQPRTHYTLTIPAHAVKNKWGTDYPTAKSVGFTTTDWQRMTLSVQPSATFITQGDPITLSCSASEATIYYSTDGRGPATRYTTPLVFREDMTLRAVARLDGYYDTELLEKDYRQRVEIVERYPALEPLYRYADVNPCITFSQRISAATTLDGISLQREDTQKATLIPVGCAPIIYGHILYLVPQEPLEVGTSYVATVPEGLLLTEKGERVKAINWHFTTGSYATAVSVGGPELTTALTRGSC